MTSVTDDTTASEYLGESSGDWRLAARQYAEQYLDLWPFQVSEMASDWEWRWEGCEVTKETMHDAYEDWISGFNPYCRAHVILLDGYDRMGQYEHDTKMACRDIANLAISMGIESRMAESMSQDIRKYHGDSVGIYNDEEYFLTWIQEWFDGTNRYSPHWVPLDAINLQERSVRLEELKARRKESKRSIPRWESELLAPRMNDLS